MDKITKQAIKLYNTENSLRAIDDKYDTEDLMSTTILHDHVGISNHDINSLNNEMEDY
jgi:hypothetical protein